MSRHQHPLDAARAEVLRYADLVASWNPEMIKVPIDAPLSMNEELKGLREAVETLRREDPRAFRGAIPDWTDLW